MITAEMVLHRDGEFPAAQLQADDELTSFRCFLHGEEVHLLPHEEKVARVILMEAKAIQDGKQPCSDYQPK